MDYQLRGKTAYVSAGAHGIGEAIADLLASEGAAVLVGDHDGDALREKAHKWHGTVTADLATADGRRSRHALRARPRSAARPTSSSTISGSAIRRRSKRSPTSAGRRSIDVNLMGTVRTCRALLPKMAARGTRRRRQHRLRPGEAARAGVHRLRRVQGGAALRDQGARQAVRADRPRQHRAAGADLVPDVDAARRHRRSARDSLRDRSRHRREAVPARSPDADGHRPAGGRRARGGLSRLAARHGSSPAPPSTSAARFAADLNVSVRAAPCDGDIT